MRRFCPTHFRLRLVPLVAASLAVSCGVLDSSPSATPTPTQAQSLGIEIAETYGQLLAQARVLVEPRPSAPAAREQLRLLREEYKVRLGKLRLPRDSLGDAEQAEVAASFDVNRDVFLPADMAWFEDAASDYDLEDAVIRERLEDIETLHDYAFLERVAQSQPGQELLCGG